MRVVAVRGLAHLAVGLLAHDREGAARIARLARERDGHDLQRLHPAVSIAWVASILQFTYRCLHYHAELEDAATEYRNKIAERDIKIEALKEATVDAKGSVAILTDRVSTCAAISAADQVIPAQMFQAWALADDKRP